MMHKISIIVGNEEFEAVLDVNPTAQSLWGQLPLEVEVEDYAGMEKIFYPPKELNLLGAPKGYKPNTGDITCYGPWGNVAIFYKNHGFANGLIYLGRIESIQEMVDAIEKNGNKITLKKIE